MNVVEEHQPNCLVTLHVEVPVDQVAREWDDVVDEFKKHAALQGYRRGFAPKKLIETRFAKEIREELQRKLLDSSLKEAIKVKELKVISILGFENVELEKNRNLRYSARLATAPAFELPPYQNIELELAAPVIGEDELTRARDDLRRAYVNYEPVEDRGLEMEDMAVVTYSTQIDGQPIEIEGVPKQLLSGKNFWVKLKPDALLPGFSEALLGMRPDETKNFELTVSEDNPVEGLRGKALAFEVTLEAINKEVLPEWSDELAEKILPGKTAEQLKDLLRETLEERAKTEFEARKRRKAIDCLLSGIQAEVPTHLVRSETQRVLREIVEENQARGVDFSHLLAQEQDIVGLAEKSAQERVLAAFLLLKIAEKENLQVTDQDVSDRIIRMAQRYDIALPKLVKDLNRKNAFGALREEILLDKSLDFIIANAVVREPASAKPVESEANPATNA